jgi:signal transduction histidine kinase
MPESLRVLITDDEPGMRMAVTRALSGFTSRVPDVDMEVAFAIDQAETGEEALEKIDGLAPDILLLDNKLPGISGLDVLDQLAGRHEDMLIIMITAYASIETAVTATKRGAYDFLPKPFTPAELRNTVRKAAARLVLARQAKRLADEKKQVRFQFIRVLGHELKAPLNAVESYLQLITGKTLGADIAAYQEPVQRSLTRIEYMRKLIADLLDMTRIESGQKTREVTELDIRHITQTAIDNAALEAEQRGITIELHAEPSIPFVGDEGELQMVMNNLVSNAVKYNRDNGKVDVHLNRSQDNDQATLSISVADTGIGMSPEEVAKLFGEFVRIRNEKTKRILGSGLGLSIVKKITSLYDGDVTVDSTPDVGTTFHVTLHSSAGGQS